MAELTINTLDKVAILDLDAELEAAGASGDTFLNDERTFLIVKNGSGSPIDVTLTAQQTTFSPAGVGELTQSDIVKTVAAGDYALLQAPPAAFNNLGTGKAAVSYSSETTVSVGAFRLERV